MIRILRLTTLSIAAFAGTALAGENIRILPDQAILACTARTDHVLMERGGGNAQPISRFQTDAMENFMFRVKGRFAAQLEGVEREIDVECDVSSNGVEVFTMVIEPMSE